MHRRRETGEGGFYEGRMSRERARCVSSCRPPSVFCTFTLIKFNNQKERVRERERESEREREHFELLLVGIPDAFRENVEELDA